jgi:hypothetical protein
LVVILPLLDPSGLVEPLLAGLFAIAYGWLLSGLSVVLLLGAWQGSRFLGIILLLGLAAGWVLGIVRHIPWTSVLLYLAPLALGALVLYVGLRFGGSQLLPSPGRGQSREAFQLLKSQLGSSGRPGFMADGGPWVGDEMHPFPGQALELPNDKPSFVITPTHQVVAISDRLQLKGIRGPGLVLLRPEERVEQIIDLRVQERDFELVGRTLDGIEVHVGASVSFQIDAGRRKPELGASLPFSRAAAFKAVHAQRVEHAGHANPSRGAERRLWDELPSVRAEHVLRDIISRMRFDELYAPRQADAASPRRAIAGTLADQLRPSLRAIGIQLVALELGNFQPTDPQVYVKRARNWQAEWIARVIEGQAEGDHEGRELLDPAQSAALRERILDVGRQLEQLAQSKTELAPGAALEQLLTELETLASRAQRRNPPPADAGERSSDVHDEVEDRDGSAG